VIGLVYLLSIFSHLKNGAKLKAKAKIWIRVIHYYIFYFENSFYPNSLFSVFEILLGTI